VSKVTVELNVFITTKPLYLKCFKVPFSYRSSDKDVSEMVWSLLRLMAMRGLAAATIRGGFLYFKGDKNKTLNLLNMISKGVDGIECEIDKVTIGCIAPISPQGAQVIREIFYRALNREALKNFYVMKLRNMNYYILKEAVARENPDYMKEIQASNGTTYRVIRGLRVTLDFINCYGLLFIDFRTFIFNKEGRNIHWIELPMTQRTEYRSFSQVGSAVRYKILNDMIKLLFGKDKYEVTFPDGDVVIFTRAFQIKSLMS